MSKKTLFICLGLIFIGMITALWYFISRPLAPVLPPVIPTNTSLVVAPIVGIEVAIISTPQGASIIIDDQNIGITPIKHTFPGLKTYKIQATKAGYVPLYLTYSPTESSLRLQLAPEGVITNYELQITNSPSPSSQLPAPSSQLPSPSPTPNSQFLIPNSTTVPFPVPPDLRILSVPNYTYTYTRTPTAAPATNITTVPAQTTQTAQSAVSTSAAKGPSVEQLQRAKDLIANYSGVHNFGPGDGVEEGTAGEEGVVISDPWFYPTSIRAFVLYPVRFINDTSGVCILHVQNAKGDTVVGTLQKNESLLFNVAYDINERMHFSCQGGSQAGIDIDFFS